MRTAMGDVICGKVSNSLFSFEPALEERSRCSVP